MNSVTQWLQQSGVYVDVPLLLLAAVAWIYRPGSKRRYEEDSRLPFDEEENKDGHNRTAKGKVAWCSSLAALGLILACSGGPFTAAFAAETQEPTAAGIRTLAGEIEQSLSRAAVDAAHCATALGKRFHQWEAQLKHVIDAKTWKTAWPRRSPFDVGA